MTTFVLAVDHRNSLRGWLGGLGLTGSESSARARNLKNLCVLALALARQELGENETLMLLLDQEYGGDAIQAARNAKLPFVIPVERSGQAEFRFEHGDDGFRQAIDRSGALMP